jgi:hypothetical protein
VGAVAAAPDTRTPEEVLAEIKRRVSSAPADLPAPPALPAVRRANNGQPTAATAAVLACALVRCADCRHVHYRSSRPPKTAAPGTPWLEWLECDHGLTVELRDLEVPTRYCTLFNRRPPSRQEI